MFKTKYRIVTDEFEGYEAWCGPFWLECYGVNSSTCVENARIKIDNHSKPKSKVVEYYNPSN